MIVGFPSTNSLETMSLLSVPDITKKGHPLGSSHSNVLISFGCNPSRKCSILSFISTNHMRRKSWQFIKLINIFGNWLPSLSKLNKFIELLGSDGAWKINSPEPILYLNWVSRILTSWRIKVSRAFSTLPYFWPWFNLILTFA